MESKFRSLPSVDKVFSNERMRQLGAVYPHHLLLSLIRKQLEGERRLIAQGKPGHSSNEIIESICLKIHTLEEPSLRRVINATGVILHTNLGRAPLSGDTIKAMETAAQGYSNLEYNLDGAARGSRHVHLEPLLCQITGAEAGFAVNNNAAAILLALTALAKRREVIVSRGQAVEIGGGFRIPDVMRQSGAKLVEVGTTNCTYASDYEQAINPHTQALMRVHSSNFTITGFVHEVTLKELVTLGKSYNLTVLDDLGSGCFLDTTGFGLKPEPMVQQSVAEGAALTFFSGDKLVGGPQAGIIVGKKELVDKLKKHPLARAVRIDKISLAGLRATLLHYLKDEATTEIPVWQMMASTLDEIERRALEWAKSLNGLAQVTHGETGIGGGSLPGSTLPTRLVAISGQGKAKVSLLSQRLRGQEVPVIGRISEDSLLLDPRTVLPEEDKLVLKALQNLASNLKQT